MRLLLVILALAPSACFYSMAYLLKYPEDWTGPAILLPVSLLLTIITQAVSLKRIRRENSGEFRNILIAAQVGSVVLGIIVGVMTYFILLD